ncbi:hypothetical protein [Citrobacter koseri]|uniref:hypothetical protein n=1 Tax=Citrobacter koseri TaxID=545 RepID=UPI002941E1E6|nr:hypothetical protein [Citrobacter koseri]WOJ03422.1 hypothetical protein R1157_02335 [Citrobacter koseri]
MTSFIKLGLFEREAKTPALNVKQLALLLCGEDPELKTAEIPEEKLKTYNIYYRHISKWMQSSELFNGGNAAAQPADYMFAMAYPMIDDDITPDPIKKRCLEAVASISVRKNGKEHLFRMGGEELYDLGVEFSRNRRGMHRKNDEQDNTIKLVGLLTKLLAKKVSHSYVNDGRPVISTIYADMVKLANEENISLRGMSKSTVYKKISDSLNSLFIDEE